MQHRGAWVGLLRLLRARVLSRPVAAEAVLQELGVEAEPDHDSEPDEFLCEVCGSWFDSLAGLHIHSAKSHGFSNEAFVKRFLDGSVCPVCTRDFRTRARAVQHLRLRDGRACKCRLALDSGDYPEVSPSARQAADRSDLLHGRRCRASGINPLAARGRGVLLAARTRECAWTLLPLEVCLLASLACFCCLGRRARFWLASSVQVSWLVGA